MDVGTSGGVFGLTEGFVFAAVDTGAPAPVLANALFNCFASRGDADFADKLLSAMRSEFGGHQERMV